MQTANTLQDLIQTHTSELEEQQQQILRLDAAVRVLREQNGNQEAEIISKDCVRVHIDNMWKTTLHNQILDNDITAISVSHEDIHVVWMMLNAAQCEFNTLTTTLSQYPCTAKVKKQSN